MSARYAPLPNPRTDPDVQNEMEAAFDDSDDDEHSESQPLNPVRTSSDPLAASAPSHSRSQSLPAPGAYDFENVDYASYPPPGSPPRPSDTALPNEIGNSNGVVPSSSTSVEPERTRRRGGWLGRTAAAFLPSSYAERFQFERVPTGPIGGGLSNDGVFANVTAKPTRPVRIQEGDQTYLVPEETSKDAPPSYASAQADAVPPYWETTVHAPTSPSSPGEIIIDSLPTGSLFSFLWNMLVSISFQFVGFLLTYLLHTTHAARLGSRAGLGVTLIQYGFALRSRAESGQEIFDGSVGGGPDSPQGSWMFRAAAEGAEAGSDTTAAMPTFTSAAEAESYIKNLQTANGNATWPVPSQDPSASMILGDATTEWLSFFLMTVGWFILLTSLLGFWRVKRWERNILASQAENAHPVASSEPYTTQIERMFGITHPGNLFRGGLGFGRGRSDDLEDVEAVEVVDEELEAARERARQMASGQRQREMMASIDPNDPDAVRRIAEAYAHEARLHQELRDAGLL